MYHLKFFGKQERILGAFWMVILFFGCTCVCAGFWGMCTSCKATRLFVCGIQSQLVIEVTRFIAMGRGFELW